MLAARLHEGAQHLDVEDVVAPEPRPDEVIVEVRSCAICASDLHAVAGHIPVGYRPITLGHEISGVVEETGQRVFVNPLVACGHCEPCGSGAPQVCSNRQIIGLQRDGGFAQRVRVPRSNVIPVPDALSFEEAAVIEPASTAFHALASRGGIRAGDRVAVFGGGGIGLFGIQIARLCGAESIALVDVSDAALERGLANGATHAVNAKAGDAAKAIRSLTGGGVDISLEAVGAPQTCAWAVGALRRGGVAAFAGVGPEPVVLPPPAVLAALEVDVRAAFGYTPDDVSRVIRLIAAGRINARAAISDVVPLSDIRRAFERFRSKEGNPVRLLIAPNQST